MKSGERMTREPKLHPVTPALEDLLTTPKARAVYEETKAALEAGRLIRSFRETAGLSQGQLAQRIGVSQPRISAIENGEGRDGPSYALIKRIAAVCEVSWPIIEVAPQSGLRDSDYQVLDAQGQRDPLLLLNATGERVGEVREIVVVPAAVGEISPGTAFADKFRPVYLSMGESGTKLAIKVKKSVQGSGSSES